MMGAKDGTPLLRLRSISCYLPIIFVYAERVKNLWSVMQVSVLEERVEQVFGESCEYCVNNGE